MKKIISLLLTVSILLSLCSTAAAEEMPWQAEYRKVILASSAVDFVLVDTSRDGIPELFCDNYGKVASYYYNGNAAVKASENKDVPFSFFENLKYMQNTRTDEMFYMGQVIYGGLLYTYKMSFPGFVPVLEVVAQENLSTGAGNFKGDADVFSNIADVQQQVSLYLEDYTEDYIPRVNINTEEIHTFGRAGAVTKAFARYEFFSRLKDDSITFSASQREKIKKSVASGRFSQFSRISVLSDDAVFVEFYVSDKQYERFELPYSKRWALVDGAFSQKNSYQTEHELITEKLKEYISVENAPSNINPDYKKCKSFRGIDDYVNYLSQLISAAGEINENGKKSIAQFMEYATNKCSRAGIKANKNVLTITESAVSIISENASMCMGQLVSLCNSKNISQIRTARTIPELVCKGVDLEKPVRVEFCDGVSASLATASGIRIMLDEDHGIYLNTAELAILEENADVFCIEYTKNGNDYSIVFTDAENTRADSIAAPVWLIVPAKYSYSSVIASYKGATDNRGGIFSEESMTIEFSAQRSGNYQVVEEDITINDTDGVNLSTSEAIRFLVSKGIFNLDRKNNFYPNQKLTRYDFTAALVKMFYTENPEAKADYKDVPEKSPYYSAVATAQASGLTKDNPDGKFYGTRPVTKEHLLALCAKVLADKKDYRFPENYIEYLQFSDKAALSADSIPYIAIAVQCGLCENAGEFEAQKAMTKAQGAEILYKTYMLLYDASAVTTSLSASFGEPVAEEKMEDLGGLVRGGMCLGITAVFAVGLILAGKMKKKEEE